ncbi:peptidase, M16 family [Deferribacter desulfuricans SSM1]|uniref:Peptidase, M16 family n=1 Tax=Deferribacter desulfuricans (strain DSM 14783 / JCM 11476 / NBRC 101012 / SSM1) TaxID=639282 RepID=D3PBL7_DEFDS|nr:pitrilysin family protein [Deferribacter desulfuricans]BAI79990.1 peptidase, M16 family [Deferribacter desulfuricans SSM1]
MKFFIKLMIILLCFGGVSLATTEFKLKNGVNVVFKQVDGVKIVSIQLWMKTGSRNENEKNNGIAHFLEHMVFKGTEKYKPSQIDEIVESNGGQMNAATSKDYTFYYITIPSKNAEVAFDVISEMVFKAKFLPEEIEKEKPVVIQEIKRKYDSPTYDMWVELSKNLYKNTTYAMEVIGTEDNVKSFTRETLFDYYNHFYHPENMTLVVVGDLSQAEVKKLAEKYFNKTKEVKSGKQIIFKPTILQKNIEKTFYKNVNQAYVAISYKAFPLTSDKIYAAEVLTEILSGGEFSLLNQKLKYEKSLVTSVFGGYMGLKYDGSFTFYFTSAPNKQKEAEKELFSLIKELKDGNLITKNDIEKAKNRLISQFLFQHEKVSSEANDIGYSYTHDIKNYYKDYEKNIERITLHDIKELAKHIFSGHYVLVKTLPEESK